MWQFYCLRLLLSPTKDQKTQSVKWCREMLKMFYKTNRIKVQTESSKNSRQKKKYQKDEKINNRAERKHQIIIRLPSVFIHMCQQQHNGVHLRHITKLYKRYSSLNPRHRYKQIRLCTRLIFSFLREKIIITILMLLTVRISLHVHFFLNLWQKQPRLGSTDQSGHLLMPYHTTWTRISGVRIPRTTRSGLTNIQHVFGSRGTFSR